MLPSPSSWGAVSIPNPARRKARPLRSPIESSALSGLLWQLDCSLMRAPFRAMCGRACGACLRGRFSAHLTGQESEKREPQGKQERQPVRHRFGAPRRLVHATIQNARARSRPNGSLHPLHEHLGPHAQKKKALAGLRATFRESTRHPLNDSKIQEHGLNARSHRAGDHLSEIA